MAKTSRINLNTTPATEDTKKFKTWRVEMAGDDSESNMVIIDTEIGKLQDKLGTQVVFSSTQPTGQIEGEIWNEELL